MPNDDAYEYRRWPMRKVHDYKTTDPTRTACGLKLKPEVQYSMFGHPFIIRPPIMAVHTFQITCHRCRPDLRPGHRGQ